MEQLPADIIDHMRRHCPTLTNAALQDRFGISYNTWRRIAADQPLRSSLAQRIISRVGRELNS